MSTAVDVVDAGAAESTPSGIESSTAATCFGEAVLVDDDVIGPIERARRARAAPQPPALDALREAQAALPDLPHVAVFDSAFHAHDARRASTYAVPARWREDGASAATDSTASRSVGRGTLDGAKARGLPPRRRLLCDGGAGRPLGRHHDGLHARSKGCRWRRGPGPSTRRPPLLAPGAGMHAGGARPRARARSRD